MENWFVKLGAAVTDCLGCHEQLRLVLRLLGEGAVVAAIVYFAVLRFWTPTRLAANMPQEAPKYGVGAWNLYESGYYEFLINHQRHPAMGGLGYAFLIMPSFWVFGDFLGNAIYTQLALAILTCLGLYLAVRWCFGAWTGLLAAVALPTYHGFEEYAHMVDTSIASAFLSMAGLLIFLWILRDSRSRLTQWLLWGLCAGWATSVRSNDLIVYTALTVVLLWRLRPGAKDACRWVAAGLLGTLPLILPVLWYNHHYCGAWYRDSRAYWSSNPFDSVSRMFGWRYALGLPDPSLELYDHGNLVFYLQFMAAHFTMWRDLPVEFSRLGGVLIFAFALLTLGGVGWVFHRARIEPLTRDLLRFAAVTVGLTLLFYSVFSSRAQRYIVPVAPFCAAFFGVGIADTIRWLWRRRITAILIPGIVLVLWTPVRETVSTHALVAGDLFPVANILTQVDANVETNAVIITTIYPPLVEHYVVRNTARRIVPLDHKRNFRVQPRRPKDPSKIPDHITTDGYPGDLENGAMDIFEFSALEDPGHIQQLLDAGLSVYVIDHSYGYAMNEQLRAMDAHFRLQAFMLWTPGDPLPRRFPRPGICVWKLMPQKPDSLRQ